ncbi:MAG TPA: ABC transporter ATP-binding protein [Candidatus Limnocylindrales bacterium]|nr:ABC transporter ATP-binding protein [Candidatus Limnocylindrales bacterium]
MSRLLAIDDLHAGYGAIDVLRGVFLGVDAGEFVAVLGPNGAGKSTLLRTISRYGTSLHGGRIRFDGTDLKQVSTERLVRLGCVHVPEGRQLFGTMSVEDNLRLGAFATNRAALARDLQAMYDRFPQLASRKDQPARTLSGGEQQMLAIGRALMAKPKLLMLDEPSTGLAPQIVEQIFALAGDLTREGTALLVVEQNAYLTLRHAHRAYVLEGGSNALSGTAEELAANPRIKEIYLGGSAG